MSLPDASEPEPEWDVFISYSRADADKISALVPALRRRGLRVFVDDTSGRRASARSNTRGGGNAPRTCERTWPRFARHSPRWRRTSRRSAASIS
jgi:hypothetical protein